jgi:hypothetical protein
MVSLTVYKPWVTSSHCILINKVLISLTHHNHTKLNKSINQIICFPAVNKELLYCHILFSFPSPVPDKYTTNRTVVHLLINIYPDDLNNCDYMLLGKKWNAECSWQCLYASTITITGFNRLLMNRYNNGFLPLLKEYSLMNIFLYPKNMMFHLLTGSILSVFEQQTPFYTFTTFQQQLTLRGRQPGH